jgi:hypothetical protein
MKRLILLLLVVSFTVQADYKLLTDYQNTLYQLITDYVDTNKTNSSTAVLEFIYSADTKTVFADALAAGYTRREVLLGVYQGSFLNHPNKVIIKALHDAVVKENVNADAAYYGSFVTMGTLGALILGLTRHFWVYFKHDRPALLYYKAHSHDYLRASTNPNSTLLPEPIIR